MVIKVLIQNFFFYRWIPIWRMLCVRPASSDKDPISAGAIYCFQLSLKSLSIQINLLYNRVQLLIDSQRAPVLPLLLPDLLGVEASEPSQSQTIDEVIPSTILSISKYFIKYIHSCVDSEASGELDYLILLKYSSFFLILWQTFEPLLSYIGFYSDFAQMPWPDTSLKLLRVHRKLFSPGTPGVAAALQPDQQYRSLHPPVLNKNKVS